MKRLIMILTILGCCAGCNWNSRMPKDIKSLYKSFVTFADQTANKYDMQWLPMGDESAAGTGYFVDSSTSCHWAFSFISAKKLTLDETRSLAQAIAYDLAEWLFTNEAYVKWLEKRHRVMENIYPDTTPKVENVGFKLSFWDENVERPFWPYIAQVRFVGGELKSYYADPETQALQDPPVVEKYIP